MWKMNPTPLFHRVTLHFEKYIALVDKSYNMSLPEKPILTLDEVVARWKHWRCDYETLHSYAERNLLVFSVYIRDLGSHKSVRVEGDTEITREVRTINFISPGHVVRRLFYFGADDSRRILEASGNEQVAVNVLYWTPDRIKEQATGHLSAKYFSRHDLVVTREQCEQFERSHRANGFAGFIRKATFLLSNPAQLKSLKFVGGALVVVATAIWAVFKWYAG
jgi:hypothetical protein